MSPTTEEARCNCETEVSNPYHPWPARIIKIIEESAARDTRTFELEWVEPEHAAAFQHKPGQFAELSIFGCGEAPISITSSPTQPDLQFCIKQMGVVTTAIHQRKVGDMIGVRGPYGNSFPLDRMEGKKLLFVAGGIGLAPLRSVINYVLDPSNRDRFAEVSILYGARSPGDLLFKDELKQWTQRDDVEYFETVDRAAEGYEGRVGFVPTLLEELAPAPADTIALTCGPPIMIKFVMQGLTKLGFEPNQMITTLEMRMKCGIGKCGRCNIGRHYVCIDGPVFTQEQLLAMPQEY